MKLGRTNVFFIITTQNTCCSLSINTPQIMFLKVPAQAC